MRVQSDPNQPQGPFDPWQWQQQPAQQPQWVQMPNGQWVQQPMYQQMPPQPSPYDAYMNQMPQMPTMQQPMPEEAPPKKKARQKKPKAPRQPSGGHAWWKTALALAVVGGVAWFFLKDLFLPGTVNTAVVELGSIGEQHAGDALIVRDETAFDDEGVQSIEYKAQEGSTVFRGNVICYVYSTGYSAKEMTALQDYRDQIKNYQQTLLKSETAYDQKMTRLENEVIQRGLEVRSLVQGARGNMTNQETILDTAIGQRQSYFRSKYSSDMRLNRLFDDESTQQQRIDSWIKQKLATQESIVSFYTDGYEYALTPSEFEKFTPSQVRAMINGQKPELSTAARGRTTLYRLVRDDNYAVLMLLKDDEWNPVEGDTYKLVLEQFSNTVVDARVLSFTRSGGELLVRLAVIGDVRDVLYMRTCSAVLGEHVDCLKVPNAAMYKQDGADGVVIVTQEGSFFTPVEVLDKADGMTYLLPVQEGVLKQGDTVRLF